MTGPALLQPLPLRSVTLPNRIVVAPMCQYSATDGCASAWHAVHIGTMACGGFGLVIMEATAVEPRGRITPHCLGLWGDAQEAALAQTLRIVRAVSPAPLGIQIAHAGRKASTHRPFRDGPRGAIDPASGGWVAAAPSGHSWGTLPAPQALATGELPAIREAFVSAANRAARLGFEYLEVHAAHGYLLASFLSPLANHRSDHYGGDRTKRMRFPLEVVSAVRKAWPADRPLGVRFGAIDGVEGGWDVDDAIAFGRELLALGVDLLSVSTAGNAPVQLTPSPGWLAPYAAAVKRGTGGTVLAVGELDDPSLAERIVASGDADAVALARGALRDPRFPWRAARALGGSAPYVPQYAWAVGP